MRATLSASRSEMDIHKPGARWRLPPVDLASDGDPCDTVGMDQHSVPDRHWLAEINRRILAGRPVPAAELDMLEALYAAYDELCDSAGSGGPPVATPRRLTPGCFRMGELGAE